MTKSITLSEPDWVTLHDRIKQDYPKSVWLVREKMRRVLGFVPREHEQWQISDPGDIRSKGWGFRFPTTTIHLDFYDDRKKTMFMMKYSEYLDGKL
jgi:hypothetical protein